MYKWLKHFSAFCFMCIVGVPEGKLIAGTIWVGKTRTVKSIQQAIHIASAGDTIMVDYGNYGGGNITISKSLVLKGVNFPVLNGRKVSSKLLLCLWAHDSEIVPHHRPSFLKSFGSYLPEKYWKFYF